MLKSIKAKISYIIYPTALGMFFLISTANASSNYPDEIQSILGLSTLPDCSLCHENGIGQRGTVTTPFGKAMLARGLEANNVDSLKNALAALEAEQTDSDRDGVPDIQALKEGKTPGAPDGPVPEFGCSDLGKLTPNAHHGVFGMACLFFVCFLIQRKRDK